MFVSECSECRFHYRHEDDATVQAIADRHKTETGHRGPFVWKVPEWWPQLRGR